MLPGSGGIITAGNELHLALPKGFVTKFEHGSLAQQGRIHEARSVDLLLELLAHDRIGTITQGIVFVETWGRKADALLASLQLTRDLSEVWFCSDQGAICMDLHSLIRTARWLQEHELGEQATKPAFWKPIRDAAQGKRDEKAIQKWAGKVGDAQALLDLLPVDPHTRLTLPRMMQAVMPWVEGGHL